METSNKEIKLLPTELANQIAAGEVVERPSSVLKELVENSLDANATSISAIIEDGGQARIQVSDNGRGINKSQLSLAVTRHATSKVASISDLSSIHSFGFRGEALPSIASVSRFRISSKEENCNEAFSLKINFGEQESLEPSSLHIGTQVEVCDLFNNIPARLKFLKTPSTELKRAQEIFTRIGLIHLDKSFEFFAGTREVISFLQKDTLFERICKIWPPSITNTLIEVDEKVYDMHISGLISDPRSLYSKADKILLYVNNRPVSDKMLVRAVRQAYKNCLTTKDYPQVIINIDINPEEVDVNVHPAKSEVRFRDEQTVFKAIYSALIKNLEKKTFFNQDFHKPINTNNSADLIRYDGKTIVSDFEEYQKYAEKDQSYVRKNTHGKTSQGIEIKGDNIGFWGRADDYALNLDKQGVYDRFLSDKEKSALDIDTPLSSVEVNVSQNLFTTNEACFEELPLGVDNTCKNNFQEPEFLCQISSSYLLFQLPSNEVFVLDQHAVHERILYEKISQNKALTVQNLLLPILLPLHQSEVSAFLEIEKDLLRYGFECTINEAKDALECTTVPYMFAQKGAEIFLQKALKNESLAIDKLFMDCACDFAIKANSKMSPQEAKSLYNEWVACNEPDFCPHGRPVYQIVNRDFLDKVFKR